MATFEDGRLTGASCELSPSAARSLYQLMVNTLGKPVVDVATLPPARFAYFEWKIGAQYLVISEPAGTDVSGRPLSKHAVFMGIKPALPLNGASQDRSATPAPAVGPSHASPSFDCSRARSISERLICSDAELAALDRELAALVRGALQATSDPQSLRKQNVAAWRVRERTCQDKSCIVNWFAERREALSKVR